MQSQRVERVALKSNIQEGQNLLRGWAWVVRLVPKVPVFDDGSPN